MCDITQVPSNVDLLTFHPKQDQSAKKLQANKTDNSKKNKKGKKLLNFLKFQGDHKETLTKVNPSRAETSPVEQDLKLSNGSSPSLSESLSKDLSLSTSENDSLGITGSDSFKSKWTSFSKMPIHRGPLGHSLSDVSEEATFDHSPDVIVAEGNLGLKIRVKNYSPPPETIVVEKNSVRETKKSEAVGIVKPNKHHLAKPNHDSYVRECKSSPTKNDPEKLNPTSDSSLSPNQDFVFSPRREVFGQILELDNEEDLPANDRISQATENFKKTTSSNLHMPTIPIKGKI